MHEWSGMSEEVRYAEKGSWSESESQPLNRR